MPKEKKYKIWLGVILGLGTFLLIGIGAAWAMLLMKPQNEELTAQNAKTEELKQTAQGLATAKQALADAEAKEVHVNEQLAFFRNRYRAFNYGPWDPAATDPKNSGYQEIAWRAQMQEFTYRFGPRLLGEILGAADSSGVHITAWDSSKIAIQAPPKGPEDLTIPANGFFKPTGDAPIPLTITGNLDQILTFFKKIHQGTILMKVGNTLKLSGSSPNISATFTVQPYLVAKGAKVVLGATGAAAPAAPAAGTAPAAGSGSAGP